MKQLNDDILNIEEDKPILTLNFKCSLEDYRKAWQVPQKKYSDGRIEYNKFIMIFLIIILPLSTYLVFVVDMGSYTGFSFIVIIIGYFMLAFSCYIERCFKKKIQPYMRIISRIFLKRLTIFYKNRTVKEIKKMIIPCEYEFYSDYFIKRTPSIEKAQKVPADKISALPLEGENFRIEYRNLKKVLQNDDYIVFYPNCFIPKRQLDKNSQDELKKIIKVIESGSKSV